MKTPIEIMVEELRRPLADNFQDPFVNFHAQLRKMRGSLPQKLESAAGEAWFWCEKIDAQWEQATPEVRVLLHELMTEKLKIYTKVLEKHLKTWKRRKTKHCWLDYQTDAWWERNANKMSAAKIIDSLPPECPKPDVGTVNRFRRSYFRFLDWINETVH